MYRFGGALRDLTEAASKGELEVAFGREDLVAQVLDTQAWVLYKNVLVVGREGSGATQLVYSVVRASLAETDRGDAARKVGQRVRADAVRANAAREDAVRYYELRASVLKAGTVQVREAVESLIKDFRRKPDRILFVEHIAPLLDPEIDMRFAAGMLGMAIQDLDIRCIGTISPEEYEELLEADPSLAQRTKVFRLGPLSEEMTMRELEQLRPALERQHAVRISEKILQRTIQLTQEYLAGQDLPGKAISTLKRACELHNQRACEAEEGPPREMDTAIKLSGNDVDSHDLKCALNEKAGADVFAAEAERWKRKLTRRMSTMVFGQEPAIDQLGTAMARIRARFKRQGCPAGVVLLGGPGGVGKTHVAHTLAFHLTQSQYGLIELDVTQAKNPGTIDDLFETVGAADTGRADTGRQSDADGTALQIVLIKRIERAHPSLLGPLLRIVTTPGCCGQAACRANLRSRCLFLLTLDTPTPEQADPSDPQWLEELLASRVRNEIVQRFDAIIPFGPLDSTARRAIMRRALADVYQKNRAPHIQIDVDDAALNLVSEQAAAKATTAWELLATLKRLVIAPVGKLIQNTIMPPGGAIHVSARKGGTHGPGSRIIVRAVTQEDPGKI